jgi:serine/threonine protein kinase
MKDVFYVNEIFSRKLQNQDQDGFASYITRFKTRKLCNFQVDKVNSRHLVLEYMGGGDFLMLLLQKAPLREDETCFYLAEMINGIDACHKLGFMHRDVKVSNLTLQSLI